MEAITHGRIEQASADAEKYPSISGQRESKGKAYIQKLCRIFLKKALRQHAFR